MTIRNSRYFVIAALAASSLLTATAAQAQRFIQPVPYLLRTNWTGFAASPNGRVFEVTNQGSEAVARSTAKFDCEQATGRTCVAIAVPMSWDVVVMTCSRPGQPPLSFIGGSSQNAAIEVALNKAFAAGVASMGG
jgi:hypothetical protein